MGWKNRATPLAAGGRSIRQDTAGVVFTTVPTAIFSDDAVFDHEIGILDALHIVHLRALKPSYISRENARQRPYIVYDGLHELIL